MTQVKSFTTIQDLVTISLLRSQRTSVPAWYSLNTFVRIVCVMSMWLSLSRHFPVLVRMAHGFCSISLGSCVHLCISSALLCVLFFPHDLIMLFNTVPHLRFIILSPLSSLLSAWATGWTGRRACRGTSFLNDLISMFIFWSTVLLDMVNS